MAVNTAREAQCCSCPRSELIVSKATRLREGEGSCSCPLKLFLALGMARVWRAGMHVSPGLSRQANR